MNILKNNLATHKNIETKCEDFYRACDAGGVAYTSEGQIVPLTKLEPYQVEFIGGAWRVQNQFTQPIQIVRDRMFVLGKKLPLKEKNHFDFYHASLVSENCYGKYIMNSNQFIVAKYATDKGTYWSYGPTVEQARAFLGIKLYDEYMDLIHSVACKNTQNKKQK